MRNTSLKSAVKFWQEFVLIVPIVLILSEITKNRVILTQTIDGWDIFAIVWLLPLLVCLVGQFFWKNDAVAFILSVPLGLSAVAVVFMGLWGIKNSPSYRMESVLVFLIGVVSVIAVISMYRKYHLKITETKIT